MLWKQNRSRLPRASPQQLKVDDQNTLTLVEKFGLLTQKPLRLRKASQSPYHPNFELHAKEPVLDGKIVIEWEFVIDEVEHQARNREGEALSVETFASFGIYSVRGKIPFRITVLGHQEGKLVLRANPEFETVQPSPSFEFQPGEVLKIALEINLSHGNLSVRVNGQPFGDEIKHDDLTSFYGMRIGEGTALGGNYGSTFTLFLDNLKVTHE